MANIKFDLDNTIKAIHSKGAFVSAIAEALGVSRNTVCRWRKKYKAVDEAFADVEESKLDFTESKLMEAIKQSEAWAICFFLKCKGKNRGYVERQEVTFSKERWTELQDTIIEALSDFPEAKDHVVKTLKGRLNGDGESRRY